MPVETATFLSDLVGTNPPTSDLETQGANHLQLIKTVLLNTFGNNVHRFLGAPTIGTGTNGQNITAQQAQTLWLVDTTVGNVTITLPTLGASDAGWSCSFMKVNNGINPLFVQPPSGTIQSGEYALLAKARRSIPMKESKAFWTGASWVITRVHSVPVGSLTDWCGGVLAVGYEWPNGQTLGGVGGSLYPEFFGQYGQLVTPDIRGRSVFGLDNMGGAAAGRISVAGGNFDGTINGGAGGAQNHTLTISEAPPGQLTFAFNDPQHSHGVTLTGGGQLGSADTGTYTNAGPSGQVSGSGGGVSINPASTGITAVLTDHAGGNPHTILPPAVTLAKLLIVE